MEFYLHTFFFSFLKKVSIFVHLALLRSKLLSFKSLFHYLLFFCLKECTHWIWIRYFLYQILSHVRQQLLSIDFQADEYLFCWAYAESVNELGALRCVPSVLNWNVLSVEHFNVNCNDDNRFILCVVAWKYIWGSDVVENLIRRVTDAYSLNHHLVVATHFHFAILIRIIVSVTLYFLFSLFYWKIISIFSYRFPSMKHYEYACPKLSH